MKNTAPETDASISALLKDAAARRLTHVSIGCVDWNGRLRTKQLAVGQLEKALCEGTAITSAIFATDTAEKPIETGRFHDPANGYPDAWLKLDPSSARRDPLTDSAPGMVILGQLDGEFAQYCPRAILAREVARLAALDLRARCAFDCLRRISIHINASAPPPSRHAPIAGDSIIKPPRSASSPPNAELARIEVRVPGADVNSYLALSAIVAAGRRGVALALEPTAPARGNAWDNDAPRGAPFPLALAAALGGWRNSALARETFGAEFVPEFAASRDWQLTQFARAVTDGEVRQFAEGV